MSGPTRASLLQRAILALVLTIGFYLLAALFAIACFAELYALFAYVERIPVQLAAVLFIMPFVVLWSILPRRDKFVPPGPRIDLKQQPELAAAITDVAGRTGQTPPAEVYLIHDVNAFVSERGGVMGIGSRRVMGIGLPLLQALTVSQFRGVLAHEFGHFQGGDTQLGGWIYKVRASMARTIDNLGSSIMQAPFRWYGNLFMRATQAISRQQEFEADRLAASVVGSRIMSGALRATTRSAPAFHTYWHNEVIPILEGDLRPPITTGFGAYLQTPSVVQMLDKWSSETAKQTTDPYDTHPALNERVHAIDALNLDLGEGDTRPASTLLRDLPALEAALLAHLSSATRVQELQPVSWELAGVAYIRRWQRSQALYASALRGLRARDLFDFIRRPSQTYLDLARQHTGHMLMTSVDAQRYAAASAGSALALLLTRDGWMLEPVLGNPLVLAKDGRRVEPHALANDVLDGRLDEPGWVALAGQLGVAETPLM